MAAFYDWASGEALGDQHRTVHNELGYITRGAGDPEGSVTADVGSVYVRSDGAGGTTFYVKETGSGNTGWVAVVSAAGHTSDTDDAHDASAISVLDSAAQITATDVEGALAEIVDSSQTHEGAADPHTGYRLESADHSHASTGLQAGTIDHGAITGLTDDDHTQYLKESDVDAVTFTIGVFFDGNGAALTTGVRPIWRAPFACTVTAVRAYADTGTTTVVNAGTGAASGEDFCSGNITIDPADAWEAGTVDQNQTVTVGETVSVEIVTAGTATQVTIQIELTRDLSP